MTDRGKLEYRIVTKDEFTADLAKFQREINNSQLAFRTFRTELGKVGATSRQFTTSLGNLRNATNLTAVAVNRRAGAIERLTQAQVANTAAENANRAAGQRGLTSTQAEAQAEAQRQRILRSLSQDLRRLTRDTAVSNAESRRTVSATRRATAAMKGQTAAAGALRSGVRNLFFSFRRLVGVLAIFTAAREIAGGFTRLVRESVRFSSALEQNALGIASLIASVGDMRDSFGNTQDAATRLNLSQGESRRQLRLLQAEAQRTAASFEDLAFAFQTGIGFGLEAGLDIDQVRKFTVSVSQAASAIGLEQNQLAEEIRSLLSGTINPRNTRIATILNISNKDVANAREAGVLAEFLEEKFEAFTEAGKLATQTFQGLSTNTIDAFRRLISEANFNFFNEIKDALRDTLGSIESINEEGFLEVNPGVLAAFQGLGASLAAIVANIREVAGELSLAETGSAIGLLGDSLEIAAEVVVGVLDGIIRAVAGIQELVSVLFSLGSALLPVAATLETLAGNNGLGEAVSLLVQVVTLMGALEVLSLAVAFAMSKWPLIVAATSMGLVAAAIDTVAGNVEETNDNLTGTVLLAAALASSFLEAVDAISPTRLAIQFKILGVTLVRDVLEPMKQIIATFKGLVGAFSADQVTRSVLASQSVITTLGTALAELERQEKANDAERAKRSQFFDEGLIEAAQSGDGVAAVIARMGELMGIVSVETEKSTKEFEKQGGILVRNVKRLADQEAVVKKLTSGLVAAQQSLDFTRAFEGIERGSEAGKALELSLKAQLATEKATLPFVKERARLAAELILLHRTLGLVLAENAIRRAKGITDLLGFDKVAGEIVAKRQQLVGIEQDILSITQQIGAARDKNLLAAANTTAQRRELTNKGAAKGLALQNQANAARARGDTTLASSLDSQGRELDLINERSSALGELDREIRGLEDLNTLAASDELLALDSGDLDAATGFSNDQADIQKALTFASQERGLVEEEITAEIGEQVAVTKELQNQMENPLSAAVSTLAKEFADSGAVYKATLQVLRQSISSFASFASDAIVDALDPTTDTDLLQRFANFLQQLSKMIIQTFIQIAIAKAISGLAGAAANVAAPGAGGAVPALGQAAGGSVPGGPFGASAAHFATGVQSFAHGGRPAGIPASDTVPAWLTPGEFVMRTSAVGRYGADIMAAINRGLIDPSALSAIAGSTRNVRARAPKVPAFAQGGAVAADATTAPAAQTASISRAVVVADERSFERMLAQGRRPMLELLRSEVPGIVANARGAGLL